MLLFAVNTLPANLVLWVVVSDTNNFITTILIMAF